MHFQHLYVCYMEVGVLIILLLLIIILLLSLFFTVIEFSLGRSSPYVSNN